jgi:hypothetical protein
VGSSHAGSVADVSVMPIILSANANGSTIVVAEQIARWLEPPQPSALASGGSVAQTLGKLRAARARQKCREPEARADPALCAASRPSPTGRHAGGFVTGSEMIRYD